MLGPRLAQDVIAFRSQDAAPFVRRMIDREPDVRGRLAQGSVQEQPGGAKAGQAEKCATIVHSAALEPSLLTNPDSGFPQALERFNAFDLEPGPPGHSFGNGRDACAKAYFHPSAVRT